LSGIARSKYLTVVRPDGALYAFPRLDKANLPNFADARFAMELLEREHVLVVPGSSFNVPYDDHLRLTFLPDEETVREVFVRMERLLDEWSEGRVPERAL
jgi:alanine-synthesizing transaminase